jgi:hypothetical protein
LLILIRCLIKIWSIVCSWPIFSFVFFALRFYWSWTPDASTKHIQTTWLFIPDNKKTTRVNKWCKCSLVVHGKSFRQFLLACRRLLYVQSQLSTPRQHKNLVFYLLFIIIQTHYYFNRYFIPESDKSKFDNYVNDHKLLTDITF